MQKKINEETDPLEISRPELNKTHLKLVFNVYIKDQALKSLLVQF